MTAREMKSLFVWARYDTSFLPEYSLQLIEASQARGHQCAGGLPPLRALHHGPDPVQIPGRLPVVPVPAQAPVNAPAASSLLTKRPVPSYDGLNTEKGGGPGK